ncbi:MAG: DUF4869 domain-containing protein [Lachnospiraceae bacterium]|nr:DUF4869 domain-containing protein [Lachnospiraceae bacterium]
MLNIYFGDTDDVIYNTAVYFKNTYNEKWLTKELTKQMILDVDKSEVVSEKVINSPVLGMISPEQLSGGVKTLMLVAYDKKHVFNASTCGDNCAKWLLKIAENEKREINLRHIMNFGDGEFKIRVLNTNRIVHNMKELILEAGRYV